MRKWTPDELQYLTDHYAADGPVDVAAVLGRTRKAVLGAAYANNVPGDFKLGRTRASATRRRQNVPMDRDYFRTWAAGMAYTLGFLWADGCIDKRLTHFAIVQHARDADILEQIAVDCSFRGQLKRRGSFTDGRGSLNGAQVRLQVNSMDLVQDLMNVHGLCPRKSYLNPAYPAVPDEFFPHYLRGYFDGDGWMSRSARGHWRMGLVGSASFIAGMAAQACRLAVVAARSVYDRKHHVSVMWSSCADLTKVGRMMYGHAPAPIICGSRKRAKWEQFFRERVHQPLQSD